MTLAGGGPMEFRILGSLEIDDAGQQLPLGGLRERKILAALLLDAGRLVPLPRLVDVAWDEDPPASAVKQARNAVSRLRRRLAAGGRPQIVADGPGYRLVLGEARLDAQAAEDLAGRAAAAASAGQTAEAARLLRSALDLFRGPVLAGMPGRAIEAAAAGWEERRLALTETYCEHLLALGRHREAAAELATLAAGHPLRETAVCQLMLARYREGRRAEALALYRHTRELLAEELGIDPGPDLQRLHQRILEDDPALAAPGPAAGAPVAGPGTAGPAVQVVPRQLPAAIPYFTGRDEELRSLDALLEETAGTPRTVVISAIAGTAGVGKTALAVHWAHRAAERFPDGQLYVNLNGFGPSGKPVNPAQAVRSFLAALGVPPKRIPPDVAAQAGLYRSLLAGRRVLIMADNARDAAQVRPLLPGSPGCLTVVTSRSDLAGLAAATGAYLHSLGVLPGPGARKLLAARIGTGRAAAEPEAVAEIARLCANLPLALAVAAARAAARPHIPLAALAAELRNARTRLDALDTGDAAAGVRTVLGWSYRQLTGPAAAMFRLLGMHPGPDISLAAAASLAGIPRETARGALGELTRASLLTEPVLGRFAFHDLLRAYAAEQAHAKDTEATRDAAIDRMLDHYLHTAHGAMLTLVSTRRHVILAPPARGTAPENMASDTDAVAWFEAEHAALLAVTSLAADTGRDRHAWQIPRAMEPFLDFRGHWHDRAASQRAALTAAQRLGDPLALAWAHDGLAGACLRLSQFDEAHAHLTQAGPLYEKAGQRDGQARVHLHLANVLGQKQQWRDALAQAMQGLELFRAIGDKAGQAWALNEVGWAHVNVGEHQQALDVCQQALDLYRELGNPRGTANTLHTLGYANYRLSRHAAAADCYHRALALDRESGDRYGQATVLTDLGETLQDAGRPGQAREAWQEALAILDDLGHPDADRVRNRLRATSR